jgi:hypothetical protein
VASSVITLGQHSRGRPSRAFSATTAIGNTSAIGVGRDWSFLGGEPRLRRREVIPGTCRGDSRARLNSPSFRTHGSAHRLQRLDGDGDPAKTPSVALRRQRLIKLVPLLPASDRRRRRFLSAGVRWWSRTAKPIAEDVALRVSRPNTHGKPHPPAPQRRGRRNALADAMRRKGPSGIDNAIFTSTSFNPFRYANGCIRQTE